MSVKIKLPGKIFHKYTNGQDLIKVEGDTLGECLNDLIRQFPGMRPWVFHRQDSGQEILKIAVLLVNGKSVYPFNTETPVKDGDEITLTMAILGG